MSDDLLVPDKRLAVPETRIVSIDDERRERDERRRGIPAENDLISVRQVRALLEDFVSKEEMLKIIARVNKGISDASLAVGEKVYDQIDEENAAALERLHHAITQQIREEFERRSWRGRIRESWLALKDRVMPWLMVLGIVSPIAERPNVKLVDAVEALDPNVQAEARESFEVEVPGPSTVTITPP